MRIACCPDRLPLRALRRLPGGTRRSFRSVALFRTISFSCACRWTACDHLATRSRSNTASVCRSRKLRINVLDNSAPRYWCQTLRVPRRRPRAHPRPRRLRRPHRRRAGAGRRAAARGPRLRPHRPRLLHRSLTVLPTPAPRLQDGERCAVMRCVRCGRELTRSWAPHDITGVTARRDSPDTIPERSVPAQREEGGWRKLQMSPRSAS